jgi:hypothetical protein
MMKKIKIILIGALLASCGHEHKDDKVVGNVHDLYLKEVNQMKADMSKNMSVFRKRIADSVRVSFGKALEGKGWYSAKDMHLPTGTIIDFNPTDMDAQAGPFYIIIKGFDGKQFINKVDREKWLLLQRGDILK